jgi:DNA-binding MarR family transcriptional regulator/ABC-type dipeptide/oligopeptide/nickel transport system ATPase subunit
MKLKHKQPENELFITANQFWDLERLYLDLGQQKSTSRGRKTQLTPVEKAILRGLLCNYSPKEIAAALHWTPGTLYVELTKGLYRYVEILTGKETNILKNWRDIPNWLEAAGYKSPKQRHDWGDSPELTVFYGRTRELDTLKQWIGKQEYRLVSILGRSGIGKTSLAVKLAQEIQGEFEYIIWRSLRDSPPLNQLLVQFIQFLSNQQQDNLSEDSNVLISRFIECLRQHRCLIVFDDVQMLMRSCTHAGQYRERYEDYSELLTHISRERHQSCLVINSREKPIQIELLEQETSYVGSLKLTGLLPEKAQKILQANHLSGNQQEWQELIKLYRGNPLALNTIVATIKDFFNGSVSDFLAWNSVIVTEPLQAKLMEQLHRLDSSEMEIIRYLARNPTPVSREQLRNDIDLGSDSRLINALKSLERRSLIENIKQRSEVFFTIPPVLMNIAREQYSMNSNYTTSGFLSTASRYLLANNLNLR